MIRICAPEFDDGDVERIRRVLESGQLVQAGQVAEFERLASEWIGAEVIACNSGTAALHLALLALGIGRGDEVIVPAFTWPSTAHAIVQVGADPVFVDIDPETLNLAHGGIAAAMTSRTRALLPVHLFGMPAPMSEVMAAAVERGVHVIEDAACALGTRHALGLAGTIGDIGCFSLHPRKSITTGEGGLIATRSAELAAALRSWRNHGQVMGADGVRFEHPGLNYRLPEIGGALGIGQMARLDRILSRRREIGRRYCELLPSVAGVRVPRGLADPGHCFQAVVVDAGGPERRERIRSRLRELGVETATGTYSVPHQPWYRRRWGFGDGDFPESLRAMGALIALPVHGLMELRDVDAVVEALRTACSSGPG